MSKFTKPKSIAELAEIAKSVRCTGVERDYANDLKYLSHPFSFRVTFSSQFGEMTSLMHDSRIAFPPTDFLESLEYSFLHHDVKHNIKTRFGALFGQPMTSNDILDILDYIADD